MVHQRCQRARVGIHSQSLDRLVEVPDIPDEQLTISHLADAGGDELVFVDPGNSARLDALMAICLLWNRSQNLAVLLDKEVSSTPGLTWIGAVASCRGSHS